MRKQEEKVSWNDRSKEDPNQDARETVRKLDVESISHYDQRIRDKSKIHDVQMIQIAQGIEVGGEYGTL